MKAYEQTNPIISSVHFLFLMLTVMFTSNPIISLTALTGAILFNIVAGQARVLKSDYKFFLLIFILVTLSNPLFSPVGNTVLIKVFAITVTLESLAYGASTALMLISVMLWCRILCLTLAGDRIIYLFKGHMPKLALIISMSLHYIPMIKREWKHISDTQKTLGNYCLSNTKGKIRLYLSCFSTLISCSLENAAQTVKSMEARGYGSTARTSCSEYPFRFSDTLLLIVYVILFSSVTAAASMGCIGFVFYPELEGVKTADSPTYTAIAYLCFGLMSLLPFLTELKELVQWNFCRSKI